MLYLAQNGADVIINFFRNRFPTEGTAHEIEKLGRRAGYFIHNAASGYSRPVIGQKPKGCDRTMNINAQPAVWGTASHSFNEGDIVVMVPAGRLVRPK